MTSTPTYEVAQREDGSWGLKCSDGRIIGTAKTEAEAQFGVDVATWQHENVVAQLLAAANMARRFLITDLEEPGRTVFWGLVYAIAKAEGRS